jgi:hypothetical protein
MNLQVPQRAASQEELISMELISFDDNNRD